MEIKLIYHNNHIDFKKFPTNEKLKKLTKLFAFIMISFIMSYPLTKGYGLNTSALETLNGGQFILLTLKQPW